MPLQLRFGHLVGASLLVFSIVSLSYWSSLTDVPSDRGQVVRPERPMEVEAQPVPVRKQRRPKRSLNGTNTTEEGTNFSWNLKEPKKSRWYLYKKSCVNPQVLSASVNSSEPSVHMILSKGSQHPRPKRHLLSILCGCKEDQHLQLHRLVKSIILTQGSERYSKGNFDWDLWVLMDNYALKMYSPGLETLANQTRMFGNQSRVTVHLISNYDLMQAHGETIGLFPFEPCFTMFFYAAEVLPPEVTEVIVLGTDTLVVNDLELHWENALEMGWDSSKLFALAEEKIGASILPDGAEWRHGWEVTGLHRRTVLTFKHACKTKKPKHRPPKPSDTRRRKKPDAVDLHRFFLRGVGTGSHIMSLRNAKKYQLVKWMADLGNRFDPKSFGLGDQHIVNRYGMEHPERMTILQCNTDIRAIGYCDIDLHPPIVLHGTGGRFEMIPRDNYKILHDQRFWMTFANEVENMFSEVVSGGFTTLKNTSIWTGVSESARERLVSTIGGGNNLVGAMSPKINLPRIEKLADAIDFPTWNSKYLSNYVDQHDYKTLLRNTLGCDAMRNSALLAICYSLVNVFL